MAGPGGGFDAEVIPVCEHYLGRPRSREGEAGTPGERAVWSCGGCGGDFVAHGGRAGCPDPACPTPAKSGAFDLVAAFENVRKEKQMLFVVRKVRELAAARSAKLARLRDRARARRRARAAEAEAQGEHGPGAEGGETDSDARGKGERGRGGSRGEGESPVEAGIGEEFEAWRRQRDEERRQEEAKREAERHEAEERH